MVVCAAQLVRPLPSVWAVVESVIDNLTSLSVDNVLPVDLAEYLLDVQLLRALRRMQLCREDSRAYTRIIDAPIFASFVVGHRGWLGGMHAHAARMAQLAEALHDSGSTSTRLDSISQHVVIMPCATSYTRNPNHHRCARQHLSPRAEPDYLRIPHGSSALPSTRPRAIGVRCLSVASVPWSVTPVRWRVATATPVCGRVRRLEHPGDDDTTPAGASLPRKLADHPRHHGHPVPTGGGQPACR